MFLPISTGVNNDGLVIDHSHVTPLEIDVHMCYQLLYKKKILPAAVVCMCTSSGRVRLPMTFTPPIPPAACTGATFLSVCQFSCYSTKFSHLALR